MKPPAPHTNTFTMHLPYKNGPSQVLLGSYPCLKPILAEHISLGDKSTSGNTAGHSAIFQRRGLQIPEGWDQEIGMQKKWTRCVISSPLYGTGFSSSFH